MATQDLGERITRMFNFVYEVNGDYYVLGRDYFRYCTDLEMDVYKGFREALEGKKEEWIIEQYKRVRKYVSDCRPDSRSREKEIAEFVQELSDEEWETLNRQVDLAMEYARVAYK